MSVLGGEAVAFLDKLIFELDVIEGLSVEDDPERAVLVFDWLGATIDPDDAQACIAHSKTGFDVDARFVWSPVAQSGNHPHEDSL